MNAKVLCMASAKGGAGKTSLVATVGTFLSQLGKRVLFIDADFSTNGLTLFFLKEVQVAGELSFSKSIKPKGLWDIISSENVAEFCLVSINEKLDFLPATFGLDVPRSPLGERYALRLKGVLDELRDEYDYILIDAQAGADAMARAAMSRGISDEVVILSEYDPMSAAGVERLKASMREDLTYDRTWVLLNKILPEFSKSFSDFLSVAKYLSPIPWDAEVVRAYARRSLAINSETGNEYTLAIVQTLKGLLGDGISAELTEWVNGRAAVIRQPIEQQYKDVELEIEAVLKSQYLLERKKSKQQIYTFGMTFAGIVSSAAFSWTIVKDFLTSEIAAGSFFQLQYLLRKMFGENLASIGWVFATVVGTALTIPIVTFIQRMTSESDIRRKLELSRLHRQLTVSEERLAKLEILRQLEPEMLIKNKTRESI